MVNGPASKALIEEEFGDDINQAANHLKLEFQKFVVDDGCTNAAYTSPIAAAIGLLNLLRAGGEGKGASLQIPPSHKIPQKFTKVRT